MTSTNVTFTLNSKRVTIATSSVEYTFNNQIGQPISIPSTSDTKTDSTKIVNLLKYTERFVINGYIATGLANQVGPPVERTNAADVKADLIEMAKTRKASSMSYEGNTYLVTFEKLSARENSFDGGSEAPDGVMRYDVQISVVVGELIV